MVLRMVAFHLLERADENILKWKDSLEHADMSRSGGLDDIFCICRMEYEDLDKTSKLIFLDLAILAEGICHTHMDFRIGDLEWDA